jgi:hypothetical protein
VLLWPGGGKRTTLDRARAAIGDGRVIHVVLQNAFRFSARRGRRGRTITPTDEVEIWSDRTSRRGT